MSIAYHFDHYDEDTVEVYLVHPTIFGQLVLAWGNQPDLRLKLIGIH